MRNASGPAGALNVAFGRREDHGERTYEPSRSPISSSVLLVGVSHYRPANVRMAAVTCDDTRTLKFTLIVQRMIACVEFSHTYVLSGMFTRVLERARDEKA